MQRVCKKNGLKVRLNKITYKKLTDSKIVQIFGCCYADEPCEECPCYKDLKCTLPPDGTNLIPRKILNLINRLQAENERLKEENETYKKINLLIATQRDIRDKEIGELQAIAESLKEDRPFIKAEAYKEFAEKVKTLFPSYNEPYQYWEIHEGTDNLLKEMVGDKECS